MATVRAERLAAFLLLACAAGMAQAVELGTLFNSAEERARLDRLRRGEPVTVTSRSRGEPEVTGFVKRSDGRNTVWIDGVPVQVATPRAGPLLDPRSVRGYAEDEAVRIERKPAK
jgi:hypothetical protein